MTAEKLNLSQSARKIHQLNCEVAEKNQMIADMQRHIDYLEDKLKGEGDGDK